ncbi:MAG TPA: tRNA-dihydrouridine synthase, partial [Paracoccaceae bacterium]|nr:tRNA-dihydrouridine synthase [Paracoccaceae bacterium]
ADSDPVDVVGRMQDYITEHLAQGGRLHQVTRHMLGLFAGTPGARQWRRILSEGASREGADFGLVRHALDAVLEARAQVVA